MDCTRGRVVGARFICARREWLFGVAASGLACLPACVCAYGSVNRKGPRERARDVLSACPQVECGRAAMAILFFITQRKARTSKDDGHSNLTESTYNNDSAADVAVSLGNVTRTRNVHNVMPLPLRIVARDAISPALNRMHVCLVFSIASLKCTLPRMFTASHCRAQCKYSV